MDSIAACCARSSSCKHGASTQAWAWMHRWRLLRPCHARIRFLLGQNAPAPGSSKVARYRGGGLALRVSPARRAWASHGDESPSFTIDLILAYYCWGIRFEMCKIISIGRNAPPWSNRVDMNISACWLLHRWIIFNKICWEKRPAKTRPDCESWRKMVRGRLGEKLHGHREIVVCGEVGAHGQLTQGEKWSKSYNQM